MLRAYILDSGENWDKYLPLVEFVATIADSPPSVCPI